jgi:drug/metabolite transporter (DMT)-like permease
MTMHFFSSGLFWFLEGIFACLFVIGFKFWMEDRGVPMPFWKWLLLGLWILFFGFTIAFVGTNLGESESTAAFRGGIIFGLTAMITAVGLWRFLFRKKED